MVPEFVQNIHISYSIEVLALQFEHIQFQSQTHGVTFTKKRKCVFFGASKKVTELIRLFLIFNYH